MLIDFTVQNFRSFGSEQTLNLVASRAQTGHDDHCVKIPHTAERVLRAAVLYGANAAGKSNLVRAIDFARDLILDGTGPMKRIALNQFRFTEDAGKPSSFEFRFMTGDHVFVYGFEITKDEVVEEWLAATNDDGKEVDIFHRRQDTMKFGPLKKFGKENLASADTLKALQFLGVRPNQLLLNKIVDLAPDHRGPLLSQVVGWFDECLTVILPEASFGPILQYLDAETGFRTFVGNFLSTIGTGIGDVSIEQAKLSAEQLPKPLVEGLQSMGDGGETMVIGSGVSLSLNPADPTQVIRRNLAARHTVGEHNFSLPFDEESDGTQRFLHLLPALYHLHTRSKVYVIDELDRSLHPLLAHALLRFFVETCSGSQQQLIVTTHETHLLDQELLRRDEVWFAEKDAEQQTHLYSLTDMKVRKDLRIEKSYLQGRFGAIPFVGGMDKLKQLIESAPGSDT